MCRGLKRLLAPPLLVILVLGTVFEDAGELCVVEVALLIDGRFSEQLVHFFIGEPITHGRQQFSQMVLMDHTFMEQKVKEVANTGGVF